jgi:Carboxypeptidase regulatory-like domain
MNIILQRLKSCGGAMVTALLLAGLLATYGSLGAFAQNETGQLSGKVMDSQMAAISGARVSVKSTENGITRDATTDAQGFYYVSSLQPGIYEVTVQAQGFADRVQKVRISVGASRRLETELSVTPVTAEQSVVEGSGGIEVNTETVQLANPISGRQLRELPTITRDPYDLITLSGNLTQLNQPNASGAQRDPAYSINGQRPGGNNVLLDGGEAIVNYTTSLGQRIPLEGVQEIQVITNGFQPEFGRASGGIINVATRQGGNDFTGSVYWFHRNRKLSTNSFENNALGIRKGQLVANQFGYALGGRIIRDRLFFFSSSEGNLVRSRENRVVLTPTPQLLTASNAATSTFFNAFPQGTAINGRVFTVGDVVALTGNTGATGTFFGLPAATPAFGQVFFNAPVDVGAGAPQDTGSTIFRMDAVISDRTLLYGRYGFEDRSLYRGAFSASPFNGFNTGSRERNHNALANLTHSFVNNWSVNGKVSYNRLNLRRDAPANASAPRLFLSNSPAAIGSFSVFLPGDLPLTPGLNNLATGPLNLTQGGLDFAGPWANQQFRFGANYFYTEDNRNFGTLQNSVALLGANLPQALNNLVSGQVSAFQVAFNPQGLLPGQTATLPLTQPNFNRSLSAHDFSLYFSHSLRALPRVNVLWGLRYDFFDTPQSRDGAVLNSFFAGDGTNFAESIRNGRFVASGNGTANGQVYKRDWDNIAPRVGLAIDLTGDGKTALRGGYGINYERPFSTVVPFLQTTNNFAVASFTAVNGTTPLPLTANNFGPLGGTTGTVTLPSFAVRGLDANLETPMIHFWNVSLERELGRNTVAAAQYVGSHGRDLYTVSNVNRPGSAAAFLNSSSPTARLNPALGPITYLTTGGRSNYNALLLEVANSTWQTIGLQMSARYRYAKTLDNVSAFNNGGLTSFATNALDPFNADNDYGPSDLDVRHRFIGTFNWEVPFQRIGDKFFGGARQVFGGWQLTGIFNVQSGPPVTLFNCTGALTAETPCPRLALSGTVDGNGLDDPTPDATIPNRFTFFNPSTTGTVTPGTVFAPFPAGTTNRNFLHGPNFWNVDMGVHKRIALTENTSIQVRGEFFNLFNQANLFVPNTVDVGSTPFVPGFKSGRRHVQLAVKLLF